MKNRIFFFKVLFLAFMILPFTRKTYSQEILNILQTEQIAKLRPIQAPDGYSEAYELFIAQPNDHFSKNSGRFQQKFFISHKSFDSPTVIEIHGYGYRKKRDCELATLLNANYVLIDHRYFGESTPESIQWEYLTPEQSAYDYHMIITYLKGIYKGKFLSTGGSKGGLDALFHTMYFEDDVSASVLYSAPLINGVNDTRMNKFIFEEVGTPEEREKLLAFQKYAFSKYDSLKPHIKLIMDKLGLSYSKSVDEILCYSLLEYPFSFWQWYGENPNEIPPANATAKEIAAHLENSLPFIGFTDQLVEALLPAGYQNAAHYGYYEFETKHLTELVNGLTIPPANMFLNSSTAIQYNPDYMNAVIDYLQNDASNIIFLYGEFDPWTAAKPDFELNENVLVHVIPDKSHNVKLNDSPEKQILKAKITNWLGTM